MEFFIRANSFAAPFFSDDSTHYVEAETPAAALEKFAAEYKHPAGLYAAGCYASADAYHKHQDPIARWLSNSAREKARATDGLGGYSMRGISPGEFEINGKRHVVENPRGGMVMP